MTNSVVTFTGNFVKAGSGLKNTYVSLDYLETLLMMDDGDIELLMDIVEEAMQSVFQANSENMYKVESLSPQHKK